MTDEYKPRLPIPLYICLQDGIQMLMALRLNGCPSIDTATATVRAWDMALAHGKKWDKHEAAADVKRFQDGFAILAGKMKTWPSPADFLDCLPKREEAAPLLLGYRFQPSEAEKAKAKAEIAKLNAILANAPCMDRSWIHGQKSRSVEECIAIHDQRQREKGGAC